MAEKFGIISSLEPLKKGDTFEEWPLHVTIMTWFSLPERQFGAYDNMLKNMMHEYAPMTVVGQDKEQFGPEENVPVRILGRVGVLSKLHSQILPIIDRVGGEIIQQNQGYVGDAYRPHVTDQPHGTFAEDETAILRGMQLISGDIDGPRHVRATYNFLKRQQ